MNKEEIYVVIDDEPKRLRAIQILSDAKEPSFTQLNLSYRVDKEQGYIYLHFLIESNGMKGWFVDKRFINKTEITLDQLEQMLNPNFVVKEVVLSIEELQKQAESLGFELVKKERQKEVGNFGKFWDTKEDVFDFGYLNDIQNSTHPYINNGCTYKNFRHLTDEEKQKIQKNW